MNSLDINPPDFKLTGALQLIDENKKETIVNITRQRKVVPQNFYVDRTSELTPYAQSNVLGENRTKFLELIGKIPVGESELFIAALGRKDYLDEVCLCIAMNTKDATSQDTSEADFLERIHLLHIRLVSIISEVMKLTAGSKGSRRNIYQHYFYSSSPTPKDGDGVLLGLSGMKLTTLMTFGNPAFKSNIKQLVNELIGLYASEDIPIIDLIDLTIEQFNIILKLLPKETTWLKTRKERSSFFDGVSSDLDKLVDTTDKFTITAQTFNKLQKKFNDKTISLEEMMTLYELKKKDIMNTVPDKISQTVNILNAFILMYNANGTLKYKGKTLAQSSSLINDLLNSQFMIFLQTFKSQYKQRLAESMLPQSNNPTIPSGSTSFDKTNTTPLSPPQTKKAKLSSLQSTDDINLATMSDKRDNENEELEETEETEPMDVDNSDVNPTPKKKNNV